MGIGLFPPIRRVLFEKLGQKKTSDKGLFRLEFTDFKYTETFIVDSVSPMVGNPQVMAIDYGDGLTTNRLTRIDWEPVEFHIIECDGYGNGERLSSWVNSHLFNEYDLNPRASSINLIKLYDDGNIQNQQRMLYGCIPMSVNEEGTSITLKISVNHATVSFI